MDKKIPDQELLKMNRAVRAKRSTYSREEEVMEAVGAPILPGFWDNMITPTYPVKQQDNRPADNG